MCTRLCAEPLCWASLCALPKLTLCLIKLIIQATYCHFSNYYPNEAHCRYAGMQRLWLASLMGFFFVWDKNLMLLPAYVASGSNSFFFFYIFQLVLSVLWLLSYLCQHSNIGKIRSLSLTPNSPMFVKYLYSLIWKYWHWYTDKHWYCVSWRKR